jgi:phosphatidylserine decarboxylase
MASIEQNLIAKVEPVQPTSIQPGGGFCMNLELAWGRIRRSLLRRFCPGYVRDMAAKRQGDCPTCAHDIIDARDLKYHRNVCGYWFREEDDAYRWRNRLRLARPGLAEVVCFSLLFLSATLFCAVLGAWVHPGFWFGLILVLPLWAFVISFFRDPERKLPADPQALLSPADGVVTYAGEAEEPDFADGRAFRISIFLSVFNVHVNRVPRAGRVKEVRYFPGCFLDARHPECPARNEQLWIDMDESGSGRPIRVKQISGAVARRIVCWLKPGDHVVAGERFGMIKFGSRTEVLLPMSGGIEMKVRVGDKVKGGSTVLLRFGEANRGA